MLDKPEKARDLIAILEAAIPFEVTLMPELIEPLVRQEKPISKISYLGDMGGIVCHVQPEDTKSIIVVPLTHVRISRKLPFATAVLDYQKHRVKKLQRQPTTEPSEVSARSFGPAPFFSEQAPWTSTSST